jgi:hypothetical protein
LLPADDKCHGLFLETNKNARIPGSIMNFLVTKKIYDDANLLPITVYLSDEVYQQSVNIGVNIVNIVQPMFY